MHALAQARRRSGEALRKLGKLAVILREPAYWSALRHGVAAAVEHDKVPFTRDFRSVVDVGAGRGQFALVARRRFPNARLHCFEPLAEGRRKLRAVVGDAADVRVYDVALGADDTDAHFHVSADLDSSSLLSMTALQRTAFGTEETERRTISMARLEDVLSPEELVPPSLLKIDAQGYELAVLRGSGPLLPGFATVLVECSFVELYVGQALADEVTCFLRERGFRLRALFSVVCTDDGQCLQGDLLFDR